MTQEQARRKWDSLRRMTVANGCTVHEARTASALADALNKRWGFTTPADDAAFREPFDERFNRAEQTAARRFRWEYRRCGKARCRCAQTGAARHGPYRYGKKRIGRKVVSVYIGR